MKVRLLTSMAGVDFAHNQGDEIDVDQEHAKRLLESGQADPVASKAEKRAEKRVTAPGEKR